MKKTFDMGGLFGTKTITPNMDVSITVDSGHFASDLERAAQKMGSTFADLNAVAVKAVSAMAAWNQQADDLQTLISGGVNVDTAIQAVQAGVMIHPASDTEDKLTAEGKLALNIQNSLHLTESAAFHVVTCLKLNRPISADLLITKEYDPASNYVILKRPNGAGYVNVVRIDEVTLAMIDETETETVNDSIMVRPTARKITLPED